MVVGAVFLRSFFSSFTSIGLLRELLLPFISQVRRTAVEIVLDRIGQAHSCVLPGTFEFLGGGGLRFLGVGSSVSFILEPYLHLGGGGSMQRLYPWFELAVGKTLPERK